MQVFTNKKLSLKSMGVQPTQSVPIKCTKVADFVYSPREDIFFKINHSKEGLLCFYRVNINGNSMVAQWLGLHAFTVKGEASVPGLRTKIPQAAQCGHKKKKEKC